MEDPHDQDTFAWPRVQSAQPLGRPGPQGPWSPAGEERDASPRDPGWQAPGSQPGPPPEGQDAPDEPASAPAGMPTVGANTAQPNTLPALMPILRPTVLIAPS